jgi:hypothetical protein
VEPESGPTVLKRRTNVLMRDGSDASDPVPFLCECSAESCYSTVWLTPAEFDVAFADAQVVAQHHAQA